VTTIAGVADAVMGMRTKEVHGVRRTRASVPARRTDGIKDIRPAIPGALISAGNASQFSDGAGALVVMNETIASAGSGLQPLGRFLGFAVAGCEPDEMGRSARCSAVPEGC
jgi:acetyl-CoA C-acetyltransferase